MKKSKRLLAVTLALILALSVTIVGASTVTAGALSKVTLSSISYNTNASVSLSWSQDKGCTYYQIAKKKAGDARYTYIDTSVSFFGGQYYNDRDIVCGTVYYYQVRPVLMMQSGKTYGAWSNVKSITTLYRPTVTKAVDKGTSLDIGWNSIKGVSHYRLAFKRTTDKAWNYRNLKGTSYSVVNPTKDATYTIQVCPMNGSLAGQWSAVKCIVIGRASFKPVITEVTREEGSNTYAHIVWSYPIPCKEFKFYMQNASEGYWSVFDGIEGTKNYIDEPLRGQNTYYFQVRACDEYGNWSPYSSVYTYYAEYTPVIPDLH